eukprot:1294675-Prorocentrum_lima.AAC.1
MAQAEWDLQEQIRVLPLAEAKAHPSFVEAPADRAHYRANLRLRLAQILKSLVLAERLKQRT